MIKKIFIFTAVSFSMFFFISCSSLPVLNSDSILMGDINPFLKGKYRITSSIKADLPNGYNALLIGVTTADPGEDSINAVIMSVEGLVLLDVTSVKNNIVTDRAVPPLDSPAFAKGLIEDIRVAYFKPSCGDISTGRINGRFVKRYNCSNGKSVTDLTEDNNGKVIITKYEGGRLQRTVDISSINKEGLAEKIEITAPGLLGYSLYLELLEAEELQEK